MARIFAMFASSLPHALADFLTFLPLRTSLSISLLLLRAGLARDFAPLFIISFAFHFITGTAALAADFALRFNIGTTALPRVFTPVFNPTFSIGIAALTRPLNRALKLQPVCPYPLCQELPLNMGMPRPCCCSRQFVCTD